MKMQVIESHIAAQQFSNVTRMNAADYIPERQNTEAALNAETSQDENSASDDSSDDDDEVVAAIGSEESEDFEGYESDESHSEDLINTDVIQTNDNEGSDDDTILETLCRSHEVFLKKIRVSFLPPPLPPPVCNL